MSAWFGLQRLAHGLLAIAAAGLMLIAAPALSGEMLDIDRELEMLRAGKAKAHIPGARYRFAVFTYEDPDDTGLGNALATIVSHDLLMNGPVSSLGVLRYLGKLGSASGAERLRYFDKVEPLIASQEVRVAVWGVIRRAGAGLQIDSYAQLSPAALADAFSFVFPLPADAGFPGLTHRVGPDRMLVQRLELGSEAAQALSHIATGMDKLRASPANSAPVVATLPMDKVYYLAQRQGDWLKVAVAGNGKGGWLRGRGVCTGDCAPLLEVSRYVGALMVYDERGELPHRSATLADDAKAVTDQLYAVSRMRPSAGKSGAEDAKHALAKWCLPSVAGEGSRPAPGGAAACNLGAVAELIAHVGWQGAWGQERLKTGALDPAILRPLAQRLAKASLDDPRHQPTLSNLAVLFTLLGDRERADLAGRLAAGEAIPAR